MTSVKNYFDDVEIGKALPPLIKNTTTRQLVMYAGASGDYYEVHYDKDFATERGLPGIIVHGALKSGFIGQMLSDWAGAEGSIKKLDIQYRGMDIVGELIYCKGTVISKEIINGEGLVECEIWTENSATEKTTVGSAQIHLPLRT
jgi:acyl dehydratase